MKAIETITGRVSVLNRDDVDTDQIIPKQFLKRVERTGFGEFLFYDWAKEPGWDLPHQPDPGRRAQLRLRLEPRARPVGAGGLRLSGRSSRRASPTSSAPTAPRSGCCRSQLTAEECAAIAEAGEAQVDLAGQEVRWPGGAASFEIDPRDQAPAAQRPRRHRPDAGRGRGDRGLRARPRAPRPGDQRAVAQGPSHELRRDWDAATYDRISGPQQAWAAEQLDRLDAGRRRGRARRRLRLGQGHRRAGPARPARHASTPSTPRRRWSATPRQALRRPGHRALPGPGRAGAARAGRRRLLQRHLPLDPRPRRPVRRSAPQPEARRAAAGPVRRARQHRRLPAPGRGGGGRGAVRALLRRLAQALELRHRRGDGRAPASAPASTEVSCWLEDRPTTPGGAAQLRAHRVPGPPPRPAAAPSCASRSSTGCSSAPESRWCSATCA